MLKRSADLRLRDGDPCKDGERERYCDERAPAPGDEGGADHDDEQRSEARLREGDQQPEPGHDEHATAASDHLSERPTHDEDDDGAIAMTRNRPYTDGSQKTEFTRKNGAYAFELPSFGFWKMLRVSYW